MTNLAERIGKLEKISQRLLAEEKGFDLGECEAGTLISKHPFMDTLFIFLDHLETFAMITEPDDSVIYVNQPMIDWLNKLGASFDLKSKKPWWEQIGWATNPSDKGICTQECMQKRKVINHYVPSRYIDGLRYEVMCIPLKYNGVAAVLSLIRPVDTND